LRPKTVIRVISRGTAANDCGFNRSMQHLNSYYREEDVENEVSDENLLHRD
jgi:hypothetical protein